MLMVIFGAGASYDSVSTYPPPSNATEKGQYWQWRPPLANQLFDDRPSFVSLIADLPWCQPVVTYLRHFPMGSSVEHELEKLQGEATEDPVRFRQLAAIRYYLQAAIWRCEEEWQANVARGVTNYKTLLDQIRHRHRSGEQVCLVSFNYDRMLEEALGTVAVHISGFSDYIATDYKVIKLHGSVDWAHPVKTILRDENDAITTSRYDVIENVSRLEIGSEHVRVRELQGQRDDEHALFPALAIPVESEKKYECPDDHLAVLDDCILQVSKLLIVGWSATEKNFLRLLSENLRDDLLVRVVGSGTGSAGRIIQKLENAGVTGRFTLSGSGFSDFVAHHEADEFLKE